jgi:hypothetical protein
MWHGVMATRSQEVEVHGYEMTIMVEMHMK